MSRLSAGLQLECPQVHLGVGRTPYRLTAGFQPGFSTSAFRHLRGPKRLKPLVEKPR
jgi:hypothetical protein